MNAAADKLLRSLTITVLAAHHTVIAGQWSHRRPNRDPYTRLYVVTSGSGRLRRGGRTWELRPGSIYLLPANRPFEFGPSRGMGHLWVHFIARVAAGVELFSLVDPPFEVPAGACHTRVAEEFSRGRLDPFAAETRVRLLLEPFLDAGQWSGSWSTVNRFAPAIRYVEEHLSERITTAEMAATVGLHPTYFANEFSRAVGRSPREYLRAKRIQAAQMMLLHTDRPIKAIAAETGFRQSAYFCRVFGHLTELTPTEYRNRGVV